MFRFMIFSLLLICSASVGNANLFSEFEPNPAGADPTESTFELSGIPGTAFDLNILSIENDGISGLVDRAANVMGMYDTNGLAVVTVPDLENPTFTLLLTENTVAIGTDLDAADGGTLDVSALGTIYDVVGVSDSTGDDSTLYSVGLGGASILHNGEFEPLGVFRDSDSGDFYQYVTVDFGGPNEHIGVFAANGGAELDATSFNTDPTAATFGATNPALVPEPSAFAMLGLAFVLSLGFVRRRNHLQV